jgi:L-ribulose-5-phosphate 4-epimerase
MVRTPAADSVDNGYCLFIRQYLEGSAFARKTGAASGRDFEPDMLLGELCKEVLAANLELVRLGMVMGTFGNVSGISRGDGLVAIKPSGVPYDTLTPEQIVVTDLNGRVVESNLRPSSDLPTHIELYKHFPNIGGVAHTHSAQATVWAQARRPIRCLGTTHADYFNGPIPVTAELTTAEVDGDYEKATGAVIVRTFAAINPDEIPAVLVAGHAPFCWGKNAADAVNTAAMLEFVAGLAFHTIAINPEAEELSPALREKHFYRKHGAGAYYGQAGMIEKRRP